MYDVAIVGAGPSGSTAARECAARGLSVIVLDRAEFPRDKPCGGGVTVRASNLIPFDISQIVERVTTDVSFTYRQTKGFTRSSDLDLVYMTQRRELDSLLLERAISAGATLRERAVVREVERGATSVEVRTDSETIRARTLVAADGSNGQTARLAGVQQHFWRQVAIEANVSCGPSDLERWERAFGLDVGDMPGGYGWIFPKGEHLNVGVGGWKHAGPALRGQLHRLVKYYGFEPKNLWGTRGHYLTIRRPDSPLADGNVLLVGDAAGLVDPMSDEGIYSALWSGTAAARHIASLVGGETTDMLGYAADVTSGLVPELKVSRRLHDLFHLTPGFYMELERRTYILWKLARRILRGDQTYANVMLKHRATAAGIDFISDLVRVTPMLQRKSRLHEPPPPQRFFVKQPAR